MDRGGETPEGCEPRAECATDPLAELAVRDVDLPASEDADQRLLEEVGPEQTALGTEGGEVAAKKMASVSRTPSR